MGSRRYARSPGGERRAATRRGLLRALFAAGVVTGTGAAVEPIVAHGPQDGPREQGGTGPGAPRPGEITETYRGRTIRVITAGAAGAAAGHGARTVKAERHPEASIDGVPLHLMRRADGSYLSVVTHYESHPTPLEAARAAVDELGTARLSAVSPHSI